MGKLYDNYKKNRKNAEISEYLKAVTFNLDGEVYRVIYTKKRANRYSLIHLRDNSVVWEQFPIVPRLVGRYYGDKTTVARFNDKPECATIVVIKGRPGTITGLDEGIFRSAFRFDKGLINVMSEARFKEL